MPLTLAYVGMAAFFSCHVAATDALWVSMRGRAKLALQHSAEVNHGSADCLAKPYLPNAPGYAIPRPAQLALYALLFMPVLLTLPTTAWFYGAACLLHLSCIAPSLVLQRAGHWLHSLHATPPEQAGVSGGEEEAFTAHVAVAALKRLAQGNLVGVRLNFIDAVTRVTRM